MDDEYSLDAVVDAAALAVNAPVIEATPSPIVANGVATANTPTAIARPGAENPIVPGSKRKPIVKNNDIRPFGFSKTSTTSPFLIIAAASAAVINL